MKHLGADLELRAAVDDIARRAPPTPRIAGCPERLDVVGGDTTGIECRSHEIEDEAGIVIMQIGVGIFETAGTVGGFDDGFFLANTCRRRKRGVRVKPLPMSQYSHAPRSKYQGE